MQKRLLRLLPWVVTAGLLFVLFRRIPFAEVVAAARRAPGWMVPAVRRLRASLVYLGDSFAIWKTFGWFLARMSFADVLLVRGATYLLAAINYNVGQGAIVYFVHRTRGRPIMRGVATILLVHGHQRPGAALPRDGGPSDRARRPARREGPGRVAWAGLAIYVALVAHRGRAGSTGPLSRCCWTPASAATRARSRCGSRTSRR